MASATGREWKLVGVSIAGWSLLYCACRIALRRYSADFSNRSVSFVHALVALALSVWSLGNPVAALSRISEPTTDRELLTMAISLGYFVYDTVCCAFLGYDAMNQLHHAVSVSGLLAGIIRQRCGAELVLALFLVETSNPFMHTRALMKEMGKKDSSVYTINEALFALSYLLARVVFGSVLVYKTLESGAPIIVKAMGVGILAVSLAWFQKIMTVALYRVGIMKGEKGRKER